MQSDFPREIRRIRLLLILGFGLLLTLTFLVSGANTLTALTVDNALDEVALIEEEVATVGEARLALVTAREHESDLLANYQSLGFDLAETAYIQPFGRVMNSAMLSLDKMRSLHHDEDLEHIAAIDRVEESLLAYEEEFEQFVAILRERGDLQSGQSEVVYDAINGIAFEAGNSGSHLVEAQARHTAQNFLGYLISPGIEQANRVIDNGLLLSNSLANSEELGVSALRMNDQLDLGLTVFDSIVAQNEDLVVTLIALESSADAAQTQIERLVTDEQYERTRVLVDLAAAENLARSVNLVLLIVTVTLGLTLAIIIGRSATTLTAKLAEARIEAEEANRLKSEFLATMSHELRTPLNAVIGYSQILLTGMAGDLNDLQRENQDRIYQNGSYLMELINDILDLSKIEAGRMEIKPADFDVYKWMNNVKRKTEGLAEEKGLEFKTYLDPALPGTLYADKSRLEQVVINLLSNAIKFTEEGEVELRVQAADNQKWMIQVRDTGIGIAPHEQEYIFDNFRQVDSSYRRRHGGSGLGLAIVRNIVTLMDGTIRLQSTSGKGSTFSVVFPLELQKIGTGPLLQLVEQV